MITAPRTINVQEQVEAPRSQLVLPYQFIGILERNSKTPSVQNITRCKCANTKAITLTDFNDGQSGQEIKVLGDGFTSVAANANIATATGSAHLLKQGVLYTFTKYDTIWIEEGAVVTTSSSGGIGGSGSTVGSGGDVVTIPDAAPIARNHIVIQTATLVTGEIERSAASITVRSSLLYTITMASPARIILYSTEASMLADIGRSLGTPAPIGKGILAEFSWNDEPVTINCSPIPPLVNKDDFVSVLIYYAITNRSLYPTSVMLNLLQLPLELGA